MDDDELRKDEELEGASEEETPDDELIMNGKGRKGGLDEGLEDDLESIDDLAALEDEDDEPYDDVDSW